MSRADMSSSHEIISKAMHDWHAWAVGVMAGGVAALDPALETFGVKLAFGACMALITGTMYSLGHILTKKAVAWIDAKRKKP